MRIVAAVAISATLKLKFALGKIVIDLCRLGAIFRRASVRPDSHLITRAHNPEIVHKEIVRPFVIEQFRSIPLEITALEDEKEKAYAIHQR